MVWASKIIWSCPTQANNYVGEESFMQVNGPSRQMCRPKEIRMEVVRIDLKKYYLPEDLEQDRLE